MESMPQFPETLHAGVLKLFENMTSSQVQESPAPFFPMPGAQLAPASREALPKASLQLEHLVCNPSGRRSPIGPELQRGQCIGVLLKMKRLPPGVTAAHLAVLRPHVRETIKNLVHSQVPPTLSNITECLRREGVGEPACKALLNLCHIFSSTFCLWVPEEGEVSIVLLEEPLPPLPEKTIQDLHMAVARRLPHKLNMMNLACMREAADPSSRELAEELARDGVTTLMIKNLPTSLQQPQVMDEIDNTGFGGKYDFFYMPGNFTGHHKSLGYAFLNLKDVQSMKDFVTVWHGTKRLGAKEYPLKVSAADVQGRDANAQNFGPRMHRIRNPSLRPVILGPFPEKSDQA